MHSQSVEKLMECLGREAHPRTAGNAQVDDSRMLVFGRDSTSHSKGVMGLANHRHGKES